MPGIVIESAKLIYWPVPKCACTAIKKQLAMVAGLSYSLIHDAKFTWAPDPIPGYQDVALVRHPLERLFSLWVNKIAEGHPNGKKYVDGIDLDVFSSVRERITSGMPFEDFAEVVLSIPGDRADPHWAPQNGQVPLGAKVYRMDRVGPLLSLLLPKVNPSHRSTKVWRVHFTDSLFKKASAYYREDLIRFGFCQTILIDLDGVLTDGKSYIDHTGEKLFKAFHTRDIRAIRELVYLGWEVVIMTADDWEGVFRFADKVGAVVEVVRNKASLLDRYQDFMAIGDDAWDVTVLKQAVRGFVPSNADLSVLALKGVEICQTAGGCGVVAEVLRKIIGHESKNKID